MTNEGSVTSGGGDQTLGSAHGDRAGLAATTAEDLTTKTAAATTTMPPRPGRVKAAVTWARGVRDNIEEFVRHSVFLAFPKDSLFANPVVEELFQRHCMQHWTPSFDWSAAAVVQILAWDMAAGLGHRLGLVLRFYAAFAGMVLLHKVLFLALRGRPWAWRRSRALLLCSFLLGRGVVCNLLLPDAFSDAEQELAPNPDLPRLLYAVAQSGVVATGLILSLHLHKLDTVLVCVAHGVACAFWAGFATLHLPSNEAWWHHLAAMHLMVAYVCVWLQHERERLGRHSFEQELLIERGRILHASECLIRQGTQVDFGICMQLLYQARSLEHVNF